jgi:hypothetical protein
MIKLSLKQAVAVRLSALRTGHSFPPGKFLVLISVRGRVDFRVIMRLERLGELKNPMTSSGIEPASFRLVVQCLNQLRYHVHRDKVKLSQINGRPHTFILRHRKLIVDFLLGYLMTLSLSELYSIKGMINEYGAESVKGCTK